jgi:GYF domain 2
MTEWYYASGGQQNGPVSFEKLLEIARSGGLDPVKDLVWNSTMKDWLPAGQVPGIFGSPAPVSDPANPYAAPETTWTGDLSRPAPTGEALAEIVPGSEPLDVGGCVKRGFDLTTRNFGMLLLVGIVYMAVSFAVSTVLDVIIFSLGGGLNAATSKPEPGSPQMNLMFAGLALKTIVTQILSVFLSLGVTRIGLNLVSGKEFNLGMLFAGGKKLLPALGATVLFTLMMAAGFMLLIVPGVYLALRYGFFLTAMVDRDLGVVDSFKYSSSLTTNNRMNLFLLGLLGLLVMLAGFLALCVGLFFAIPVMWLSWIVAYRWMQYGHRAALDHPGTQTPMLAGQ